MMIMFNANDDNKVDDAVDDDVDDDVQMGPSRKWLKNMPRFWSAYVGT